MEHNHRRYPVAAVSSIVVENGKVLLVKRKYPPGKGKWGLPGGHVEYGETLTEAVIREIKEETNYEIETVRYLFPCTVIKKNSPEDVDPPKYHYIIHVFEGKIIRGELKASTDAEDAAWVDLEEAFKLDLTKSTRESLRRYLDSKNNKMYDELIVFFYEKR